MAQQQMDFGETNRDEPKASYGAYEGIPPYDSYSTGSHGQKLSVEKGLAPSSGQRLALAIVSLVLWIVVFFIVMIGLNAFSPYNPGSSAFYLFLVVGVPIFTVLVLVINILFNRKH